MRALASSCHLRNLKLLTWRVACGAGDGDPACRVRVRQQKLKKASLAPGNLSPFCPAMAGATWPGVYAITKSAASRRKVAEISSHSEGLMCHRTDASVIFFSSVLHVRMHFQICYRLTV